MSRSLSQGNRVLLLIALMATSTLVVGGAVFAMTSADSATLKAALIELDDLDVKADDLWAASRTQEAALDDYVLSADPLALQRFEHAGAQADDIATEIQASADLPNVRSAFGLFETAIAEWRLRVAAPAIAAVGQNDRAGIAGFVARAADDHLAIETALATLDVELLEVRTGFEQREAEVAATTLAGALIGFGVMLLAFGVALVAVRRFGQTLERDARDASVLNRFTEVTSFASEDTEVAAANLVALGRLVRPDASVTHILNRSMDRAVPEAKTGDAIAEILPLHTLERCAGVLRGTMYVADDLADDLTVHCPIYPAAHGTLACIPLNSGESVGAVHLYWARRDALPLAVRSSIARITEHAALAIGNQRLLAALHGQANTDPRTGLANSRSFDLTVEEALKALAPHETLSILMIDVDHFKDFNDHHGHPAGDEALRAFGGVLRSCLRDGDVATRYGGEEFAVLLRGSGHDVSVAATIAERIRARSEAAIIPLAPGITDRITVSIGIASAPDEGVDRVTLLRIADEALYRAKEGGRNRVVGMMGQPGPAITATAAGPAVRGRKSPPGVATGA
jgi:diguanylate cyclase (GGDEF)-like protein